MASGGLAKLKLEMEIVGDKIVVTGLDNVTSSVDRAATTTKTATQRMAVDMNNTTSATGRMAAGFGVIATAAATAAAAAAATFAAAGNAAISYLSKIETASLGISAAFMAGGKYIDNATGKALEGQSALKAAQTDTIQIMEQLKVANMQTIATLDQLVRAYQETLPVAMNKGFNREQVLQFTQAMVQAAGAIGMSLDQMGEETRSILTGNINPRNSRIATVLGLRNEDLKEYEGNATALFNFLMGKLDAYTEAGVESQKIWAGLTSNLKDIAGQAGGMAFEGLFETAKYELTEITNSIITIDEKTRTISWNADFVENVTDVKEGINSITAELYRVSMLIDKAGGSMTAFGARTLKVAEVFTRFMTIGQFGDSLKAGSEKMTAWNKMYEDRYNASDKALQALANREAGLDAAGNPLKRATGNSTYQINPQTVEATKEAQRAAREAATDYNKYSDAMDRLNQRIREHNPLIDKQTNELQKVDDEINKLVRATPQYETSLRAAGEALKQNIVFEQQHKDAIKATSDEFKAMWQVWESTPPAEPLIIGRTAEEIKAALDLSRLSLEVKLAEVDAQEKIYQLTTGQAATQRISLLQQQLQLETGIYQNIKEQGAVGDLARTEQLQKIQQINTALLEQQKILAELTALGGATSALQEYARMAANIGAQTKGVVTDFLTGMENALTKFIRTGKASLSGLFNSLLDNLASMASKQVIGSFAGMIGSLFAAAPAMAAGPTVAAAGGLLGGTSAGGLSSLLGGLPSAIATGAKAGTSAGAMSGITAGLTAMAPMLGMMAVGYLGNSYFGSGGLMSQSTDAQKAMRGAAFGVGVGGSALIGGAAMANAGMMGTSAAALSMAGAASWIPVAGQIFAGVTALAVGLDALTGGGLFGTAWKTKETGLSLGVEDGDFAGQTYYTQKKKKAMFGGTKSRTRYGELDSMLADYLESQYGDITSAIGDGSRLVGGTGDLSGFSSAAVKINMKGKDAQAQEEALAKYFRDISNQAIDSLYTTTTTEITTRAGMWGRTITESINTSVNALDEYRKLGEDSTATFQRLTGSLKLVNDNFALLDVRLYDAGLQGAAAASVLVEAFGGLDAAARGFSNYYQSGLFTEAEQRAMEVQSATAAVNATFKDLGLTLPTTNEAFKLLVQNQLALGAAGAETAVELMKVAPAFATVTESLKQAMDDIFQSSMDNLVIASEKIIDTAKQAAEAARQALLTGLDTSIDALTALKNILTGPAAMLSPQAAYMQAQAQFASADATTAGERGMALLEASAKYFASSGGYQEDFRAVTEKLATIGGISDTAGIQLDVVQAQLDTFISIRDLIEEGNTDQYVYLKGILNETAGMSILLREYLTADQAAQDAATQAQANVAALAAAQTQLINAQKSYDVRQASLTSANAAKTAAEYGWTAKYDPITGSRIGYQQTSADASFNSLGNAPAFYGFTGNWWDMAGAQHKTAISYVPNSDPYGITAAQAAVNDAYAALVAAQTAFDAIPKYASGGITSGISFAGESGPEAVIPLPDGRTIPVRINGAADNKETVAELKEQNRLLMAILRTQQAGFSGVIDEQKKGNKSMGALESKTRLAAAA